MKQLEEKQYARKIKKRITIIICICLILCVICTITLAIIHSVVMGRYDYDHYDGDSFLRYEDIEDEYPREEISFKSGINNLSAYLYGEENEKGIIVIAPGHTDANDIKLYEMRFFVDAGYSVIGFDYTGYYTSEGNALGGYTQAVYDLDALLSHIEKHPLFSDKSIYLFGHSMGGYAKRNKILRRKCTNSK